MTNPSASATSAATVKSLFANAASMGVLSPAAAAIVTTPDMTTNIAAAMGITADDVTASNVTLINLVVDDSTSIRSVAGNREAVQDGCNFILDALLATKDEDGILATLRFLNKDKPLYPYVKIGDAIRLTQANYDPRGYTPLYDTIALNQGLVIAKAQELNGNGVQARSVTMILTDGADVGSTIHTSPESLKRLITDAQGTEQHLVLVMGISDGSTDFVDIFTRMGVPRECILTPGNNAHEIRAACMMFSKSAVRTSVAAPGTAVTGGGFGTP